MRDIQTTCVGYAPDPRGRDYPLEVVYLTEKPPGFLTRFWRLSLMKKLTLASVGVCLYVFIRALLEVLRLIFIP